MKYCNVATRKKFALQLLLPKKTEPPRKSGSAAGRRSVAYFVVEIGAGVLEHIERTREDRMEVGILGEERLESYMDIVLRNEDITALGEDIGLVSGVEHRKALVGRKVVDAGHYDVEILIIVLEIDYHVVATFVLEVDSAIFFAFRTETFLLEILIS